MVRGRQVKLRYFQVVSVFKAVYELRVLHLVVVLARDVADEDGPGQAADEAAHTEDGVHHLAAVAVAGVGHVVELQEAKPNSSYELIPPNLIGEIDWSFHKLSQHPL